MPDDHPPAIPQVTAADDLFGTHRVRNRCRRRVVGRSRASALRGRGLSRDGRGRATWRRKTLTWWRSTRISAVVDVFDRTRSPIQALSWQKIGYTSRNVTDADHAERTGLASPQVSGAAEYPAPTRFVCLGSGGRRRGPRRFPVRRPRRTRCRSRRVPGPLAWCARWRTSTRVRAGSG